MKTVLLQNLSTPTEESVGVYEVQKSPVKRRNQQLQGSCRTKKREAPKNVLEVLTLVTMLVEDPVASASETVGGDADDAKVTMEDALKKGREEADNA